LDNLFAFSTEQRNELHKLNESYDIQLSPFAVKNETSVRLFKSKNDENIIRPGFSVDVDKIIYHPLYNRYSDKTQVFSFCNNDDITRRALHVQLVSKIARTIGRPLRLNLDLIEAIALGHDIGHTPFGHKGETFLSALYQEFGGKYFNHNVHSVRVFKDICPANLTLQTLDGILCHNGEKVYTNYIPNSLNLVRDFEKLHKDCYIDEAKIKGLRPSTLEGCVVRISDILAYIGRDRQDQYKLNLLKGYDFEHNGVLGTTNPKIISNTVLNIIKNSLGQNSISMDTAVYEDLYKLKDENNKIYRHKDVDGPYDEIIQPMFKELYPALMDDLEKGNTDSVIYRHYLDRDFHMKSYSKLSNSNLKSISADIVTDFIASMTDDYFLDLFEWMFPDSRFNKLIKDIKKGYFLNPRSAL